MIFQDPMTSLNPVFTVGYQVAEALHAHNHMSKSEARKIVEQTFQDVGIPPIDMRVILMSYQAGKDKE
jgi:peptide/nickel transport system ATP-binding protein